MTVVEANIDGIVAPYHNYGGLSYGNVASEKHGLSVSNPRLAALQGLKKMKFMHDLGLPQMVMPPQLRPHKRIMHALGFDSLDAVPAPLLHQLYSASSMWAANAATISPSADSSDGKVHITPANLMSKFHRSVEPPVTANYLKQIFTGNAFVHHESLPAHAQFADEGAANHMRLSASHGDKGLHIFVYGGESKKFPARQTRVASETIARLHRLGPENILTLEQNAQAIDAGVFHNDVIAMSNEHLFIYHENAYSGPVQLNQKNYTLVVIAEKELPVSTAVSSYFFNSQLVTLPDGKMVVIAPKECEENAKANQCFSRLSSEGHITQVHYLDVRESMKNGGGPACLRLRVVLNEAEKKAVNPSVCLDDYLYGLLCGWIEKYYRDRITPDDLRDPQLANECEQALEALGDIIKIKPEGAW